MDVIFRNSLELGFDLFRRIPESLDPGPDFRRGAFFYLLQARFHDFKRKSAWILQAEEVFREMGGIKHRTDHIDMRGNLLEHLADAEVLIFPGGHPEKVDRNDHARGFQLGAGVGKNLSDAVFRRGVFDYERVLDGGKDSVARETNVVELDLVNSQVDEFQTESDGIIPYPPVIGIGPMKAFSVCPKFPCPGVFDSHFGVAFNQETVLE